MNTYVIADRADRLDRGRYVEVSPRQEIAWISRADTQVEAGEHPSEGSHSRKGQR